MGKLWDGAVVCNPYSDWYALSSSFLPLNYPITSVYLSLVVVRDQKKEDKEDDGMEADFQGYHTR
jgi:hypothetical protein